ncbi:MAG TPA: thiamine phosphate synthase, partial [Marinobacter sp.]|nr:thiamine phosphate synthase [Marinobacter sp.]
MPNPLYAITDSALTSDQLFIACTDILGAGCTWLQYRNKSQDHQRRLFEAKTLQQLCQCHEAQLIINDDIALAQQVGAAGVHLGQTDTPIAEARAVLGAEAIIGITCHDSLALADKAARAGA